MGSSATTGNGSREQLADLVQKMAVNAATKELAALGLELLKASTANPEAFGSTDLVTLLFVLAVLRLPRPLLEAAAMAVRRLTSRALTVVQRLPNADYDRVYQNTVFALCDKMGSGVQLSRSVLQDMLQLVVNAVSGQHRPSIIVRAELAMFNEGKQSLRVIQHVGFTNAIRNRDYDSHGLARHAFWERRLLHAPDARVHPFFHDYDDTADRESPLTRELISSPIQPWNCRTSRPMGVVSISGTEAFQFTRYDLALVEMFTQFLHMGMSRSKKSK